MFIDGCVSSGGLAQDYSEELWEDLIGFADYCLVGETKILKKITDENPTIGAELFSLMEEPNGSVFSIDSNKELIEQKISQRWIKGKQQVYTYTTDKGISVTCTPNHKFQLKDGTFESIDKIFNNSLELYNIFEE